jgi:uncharacterized protein YkwD
MKKLVVLLFPFISFYSTSQYAIPLSVKEDKELSKYVFNYINQYRDSIGVKPYIWTDFWYTSAKKWNDEVSNTGKWGHNRGDAWKNFKGTELIVAVPLINEKDNNYKFIADSALNKWLHSPYHVGVIIANRQEKVGDTATMKWANDITIESVLLSKYGAISSNILDYGTHKMVYIIFQLGQYSDNNIK